MAISQKQPEFLALHGWPSGTGWSGSVYILIEKTRYNNLLSHNKKNLSASSIDGAALETLIFQELRAMNDNFELGYDLFYWRTTNQLEVDFILYGQHGLIAIEVKRASTLRKRDFRGLKAFCQGLPHGARGPDLWRPVPPLWGWCNSRSDSRGSF